MRVASAEVQKIPAKNNLVNDWLYRPQSVLSIKALIESEIQGELK